MIGWHDEVVGVIKLAGEAVQRHRLVSSLGSPAGVVCSCSASSRPVVIEAGMVAPLIAFRGVLALSWSPTSA
jgi:hypothetical protein